MRNYLYHESRSIIFRIILAKIWRKLRWRILNSDMKLQCLKTNEFLLEIFKDLEKNFVKKSLFSISFYFNLSLMCYNYEKLLHFDLPVPSSVEATKNMKTIEHILKFVGIWILNEGDLKNLNHLVANYAWKIRITNDTSHGHSCPVSHFRNPPTHHTPHHESVRNHE